MSIRKTRGTAEAFPSGGNPGKKPVLVKIKEDDKDLSIDTLSLQTLGAYMFFEEVDSESSKELCEFIIKANYVFPKEVPLTILINSPGGSVYDGFGVIDLMEMSRLKIQTVAVGSIASMATLIFTAGTKGLRTMTRNSFMMTHQFSAYFEGKYHEIIAQRGHDDDLHKRFVQHFLRHSKMTEKQIKEILLGASDTWISSKDALKYGLCDRVQDPWS